MSVRKLMGCNVRARKVRGHDRRGRGRWGGTVVASSIESFVSVSPKSVSASVKSGE